LILVRLISRLAALTKSVKQACVFVHEPKLHQTLLVQDMHSTVTHFEQACCFQDLQSTVNTLSGNATQVADFLL
jgi:hypothetical protein